MKLYHSPGACSLAAHIVLRELDLPFELVQVDLGTKKTADGTDYAAINPNGYVPALQLDNGQVLTENPAILQYLADLQPERHLAPANGTFERYRLQETLNFLSSEIHRSFSPLFNKAMPVEAKEIFKARLLTRLDEVETTLARQDYLVGTQFSVADAYLFTLLGWSKSFAIDLQRWPGITKFVARVGARATVKAAQAAEAAETKAA